MAENRIGIGHLVSGVGAFVALVSLWLPWLRIDMGKLRAEPAFQAELQAGGLSQQVTAEINRFLALLPGKIDGNGWDVMQRTDIGFALAAAAVLALVFATVALGADSRATAKTMIFIGMAGMLLVLFKMASPGIPDEAESFISRGSGFMVALVGWTICAAGGILAVMNEPTGKAAEPVVAESLMTPELAHPGRPEPLPETHEVAADAGTSESPAPLVPDYMPDPTQVANSIAPPPPT